MLKLAGVWEQGYNFPLLEVVQWEFLCEEYLVDELIMCPISGVDGNVTEYATIAEAIRRNASLTPVYVDEHGETELADFQHPADALYVFGRSSNSVMDPHGITLRIDTPRNGGRLWAHQAAALVLDHRYRHGTDSH